MSYVSLSGLDDWKGWTSNDGAPMTDSNSSKMPLHLANEILLDVQIQSIIPAT